VVARVFWLVGDLLLMMSFQMSCKFVQYFIMSYSFIRHQALSSVFLSFFYESMAARRTDWEKVMKFGTQISDSLNCHHSKCEPCVAVAGLLCEI